VVLEGNMGKVESSVRAFTFRDRTVSCIPLKEVRVRAFPF
jgi:hypothetical protein